MGSFRDGVSAVIIFFQTLYLFFSIPETCLQTLPHILRKQGALITPTSMPICPELLPMIHYLNNLPPWPFWSVPWMIKEKAPGFQLGRSCHFLWTIRINNSFSVIHCLLPVICICMCVGARSCLWCLVLYWGCSLDKLSKALCYERGVPYEYAWI